MNGTAALPWCLLRPIDKLSDSLHPMMDIPGSMTLNLTAPTSGSTAGFVIMGDSSMPLGTAGEINGPTGTQFESRTAPLRLSAASCTFLTARLSLVGNGHVIRALHPNHCEHDRSQQFGNAEHQLHHEFIGRHRCRLPSVELCRNEPVPGRVKERTMASARSQPAAKPALRWLRSLARDTDGAALIEITLFMPILVLMSVAIINFGLYFSYSIQVENAAQAGAQWAITNGAGLLVELEQQCGDRRQ